MAVRLAHRGCYEIDKHIYGTVFSFECHILIESKVYLEVTMVSKDWETMS